MSQRRLLIDMPVRNEWSNIELIRTAILNCFTAVFNDLDSCRAIAMVISELLENAIKYGDWRAGEPHQLRLAITGHDDRVNVTVEHPVQATSEHVGRLQETLAWLKSFPTPAEAYLARLAEFAERPPERGISRLGLARIAYEGNCHLTAEVVGNFIRVSGEIQP